jgi:hypothetical protein
MNWPLDDNMGLFRLKIGWDIAIASCGSCVTVLPLDLFSNGIHNVSSPFCHFFVLDSFDDAICFRDQQGFVPICIVDQQFILMTFCSPGTRSNKNARLHHIPDWRGNGFLGALAGSTG